MDAPQKNGFVYRSWYRLCNVKNYFTSWVFSNKNLEENLDSLIQIDWDLFKSNIKIENEYLKKLKKVPNKAQLDNEVFYIDTKWLDCKINLLNWYLECETTIDQIDHNKPEKSELLVFYETIEKNRNLIAISKNEKEFLTEHYLIAIPMLENNINEKFRENEKCMERTQNYKHVSCNLKSQDSEDLNKQDANAINLKDIPLCDSSVVIANENINAILLLLDLLKQMKRSTLFVINWVSRTEHKKIKLAQNVEYFLVSKQWISYSLKILTNLIELDINQNFSTVKGSYQKHYKELYKKEKMASISLNSEEFCILLEEDWIILANQFQVLNSHVLKKKAKPLKSIHPYELSICIKPINVSVAFFPSSREPVDFEVFQNDTLQEMCKQIRQITKSTVNNSILIENTHLQPFILNENNTKTMFEIGVTSHYFLLLVNYDLEANERFGISGLNNLGNTCYMNSGTQCLIHLPQVALYFYLFDSNHINPGSKFVLGGALTTSFTEIVRHTWSNKDGKAFSPHEYKRNIGKCDQELASYTQEDASQQIITAINSMLEELKVQGSQSISTFKPVYEENSSLGIQELEKWRSNFNKKYSFFGQTFLGQMRYQGSCHKCDYNYDTFQLYSTFPLIVPSEKNFVQVVLFRLHSNSDSQHHTPQLCKVFYAKTGLIGEVKRRMIQEHNLQPSRAVMYISEDNELLRIADEAMPVSHSQIYNLYEIEEDASTLPLIQVNNMMIRKSKLSRKKKSTYFFPIVVPLVEKFSLEDLVKLTQKYGVLSSDIRKEDITDKVRIFFYNSEGKQCFTQPENLEEVELLWDESLVNKYLKENAKKIAPKIWTVQNSLELHVEQVINDSCQSCQKVIMMQM